MYVSALFRFPFSFALNFKMTTTNYKLNTLQVITATTMAAAEAANLCECDDGCSMNVNKQNCFLFFFCNFFLMFFNSCTILSFVSSYSFWKLMFFRIVLSLTLKKNYSQIYLFFNFFIIQIIVWYIPILELGEGTVALFLVFVKLRKYALFV